MKALLPVGGIIDHRFGILTAPNHKGVPIGIEAGMSWAADLGCIDGPEYVKRINTPKARSWLSASMLCYSTKCLFVAGHDVIGNARATRQAFYEFFHIFQPWPMAFCAQDGQEDLDFPLFGWSALFVGGTTEWKTSSAAVECIKRAQALGKYIHIGRVNWGKRYRMFARLEGSENFTYDGTRQRFEGIEKTIKGWAGYQAQPPLFTV